MNIGVYQVSSRPVALRPAAHAMQEIERNFVSAIPTEPRRVSGRAKIASPFGNMLFAACPNNERSGPLPGASRPAAHAMQEIERNFVRDPH